LDLTRHTVGAGAARRPPTKVVTPAPTVRCRFATLRPILAA
jgi:hypothetical protein